VAFGGCESAHEAPPKPIDPRPSGSDASPVVVVAADAAVDAAPSRKVFVTGAGRCGECHENMFDEWEVSAHARSVSSSVFKAAQADAKDTTCDRCHRPLAGAVAGDGIASEGVTCDVCHTLREPVPTTGGGQFRLAIDDMVKYGPRCDLKNHYFHRMGCSPEHDQAVICGTCHWWEPAGVPVFTEYADWRAGPAAKQPCQDCHMPKERAVIATGSPVRTGVPHHGLLGFAKDLRARALALEVAGRDDAGGVALTVTVTNANAGHAVPAGLPERRLIVRVRAHDAAGAEQANEQRVLGRVLVDRAGREVPFWRATRVASDTRIQAGGAWHDTFALHVTGAGTIDIEVVYRALSDAAAEQLGVTAVDEIVMARATLAYGPGKLPKTVTVKPPPAGKRPR
jgi:hypothetical protein